MKKLNRRSDTYNFIDFIRPDSPTALDDCRDAAEHLVVTTGKEAEPHWNSSAESVIGGLTALTVFYGAADKGTRCLHQVHDLLSHPQKFEAAKKVMQAHGGLLGQWGGELDYFQDKEKSSVFSTASRHLRFLGTPAIVENTATSSFDPADLKRKKLTVYLVLPPDRMRAQSGLLRLWIGGMFRAVIQCGLDEKKKVHFILDEFAALGHMQQIDDAVDKYRGYAIRLQCYLQSLGQLKTNFPTDEGQTFLSNMTKVFFGINDIQTAEFVSKTLGPETIVVEGWGSNSGWGRNRSTSSGASHSSSYGTSESGGTSGDLKQQSRELLKPDEVLNLDQRIAITLTPGIRPLWTRLIRFYEEPGLFNRPGRLQGLTDAFRTLFISVVLLLLAAVGAAALTDELRTELAKKQQTVPNLNQLAPWLVNPR